MESSRKGGVGKAIGRVCSGDCSVQESGGSKSDGEVVSVFRNGGTAGAASAGAKRWGPGREFSRDSGPVFR